MDLDDEQNLEENKPQNTPKRFDVFQNIGGKSTRKKGVQIKDEPTQSLIGGLLISNMIKKGNMKGWDKETSERVIKSIAPNETDNFVLPEATAYEEMLEKRRNLVTEKNFYSNVRKDSIKKRFSEKLEKARATLDARASMNGSKFGLDPNSKAEATPGKSTFKLVKCETDTHDLSNKHALDSGFKNKLKKSGTVFDTKVNFSQMTKKIDSTSNTKLPSIITGAQTDRPVNRDNNEDDDNVILNIMRNSN